VRPTKHIDDFGILGARGRCTIQLAAISCMADCSRRECCIKIGESSTSDIGGGHPHGRPLARGQGWRPVGSILPAALCRHPVDYEALRGNATDDRAMAAIVGSRQASTCRSRPRSRWSLRHRSLRQSARPCRSVDPRVRDHRQEPRRRRPSSENIAVIRRHPYTMKFGSLAAAPLSPGRRHAHYPVMSALKHFTGKILARHRRAALQAA